MAERPTHILTGAHIRKDRESGESVRLQAGDRVIPTERELRMFPDKFRPIGSANAPDSGRAKVLEEELEKVRGELEQANGELEQANARIQELEQAVQDAQQAAQQQAAPKGKGGK